MKKLIFLVSGGGGNLNFIAKYIKEISSKEFKIEAVIADRECGALQIAKNNNFSSYIVSYTKDTYHELQTLLSKLKPDFIITTFHKIIHKDIVCSYRNKLINLHYSLLPSFRALIGDKTVNEAIEAGCKFVGSTTHYVDIEVDNGKIISQCVFPVGDISLVRKIMSMVFRSGCINLLNSLYIVSDIQQIINNANSSLLKLDENFLLFSPALRFNTDFLTDDFWRSIETG